MKAHIKLSDNYGFGKCWNLVVTIKKKVKSFYLGQDSKFCSRVLGMETAYVVQQIGTRDINEGTKGNKKLANFIIETLELDAKKLEALQPWELSCQ